MKDLGQVVSEKKIFKDFPMKNLYALECGHFWPGGHNLNKLSRGPLGENAYQISKLLALRFQKRRFFKVFLYDKPLGGAIFGPGHYLNKLGRGPLGEATYQI